MFCRTMFDGGKKRKWNNLIQSIDNTCAISEYVSELKKQGGKMYLSWGIAWIFAGNQERSSWM